MPSSQDARNAVPPNQTTNPNSINPSKFEKPLPYPTVFGNVLDDELARVNKAREMRNTGYPESEKVCAAHEDNLIGLAFSGGGIRSATFNLGILQALAEKGLLHKIDYLSTVSGGGYVGSWLAAFTRRMTTLSPAHGGQKKTFADVEAALSPPRYDDDKRSEPPVVHWLRLYSNYLTPNAGLISGDTWAMVGTWLRNTMLNQTVFTLAFVSVLVVCQSVLVWLVKAGDRDGKAFLFGGGAILFLAAVSMAWNIVRKENPDNLLDNPIKRVNVTLTVMVPFVVSCILLNAAFWKNVEFVEGSISLWAGTTALFYLVCWGILPLIALFFSDSSKKSEERTNNENQDEQPACAKDEKPEVTIDKKSKTVKDKKSGNPIVSISALLVSAPVAGAIGGCLFRAYFLLLKYVVGSSWWSKDWLVIVFGSGLVMTIILIVGTLHIGLVGRGASDAVREWWARLGGYLKLMTVGWLLLSATCAFVPLGVRWTIAQFPKASGVTILLWIAHNFLGIKAAQSAKTSGHANDAYLKKPTGVDATNGSAIVAAVKDKLNSPAVLGAVAKIAPYVFIIGIVFILSTLVHIVTGLFFGSGYTKNLWNLSNDLQWYLLRDNYWEVLESAWAPGLALSGIGLFIAGFLLSWRVDVNEFSLHHFYRNRLVRCYLGASNPERNAEPFTGFDPDDDLSLCSLADDYPGPYPILNAALNITGGEELGYATRRAKSFAFTPVYCGYELGTKGKHDHRFDREHAFKKSYSKTEKGRSHAGQGKLASDLGITLGTAMAISGAAASPNMGYHTSPATAFFMALFDVRLGWWMGNPRYADRWESVGPPVGFTYLFSELIAQADEQKRYVYLSDGGHFENLAVYELIRRRCRLIIACDGDADGAYQFSDLLGLIEKARTDFGARIEIDFSSIRPPEGSRECPKNFVEGKIYYDPNDSDDYGLLILVKASMPPKSAIPISPRNRKLPDDVWQYCLAHSTFPHQTTADQWFDELQFESYRALGEYLGCEASELMIRQAVKETLAVQRLSWRAHASVGAAAT